MSDQDRYTHLARCFNRLEDAVRSHRVGVLTDAQLYSVHTDVLQAAREAATDGGPGPRDVFTDDEIRYLAMNDGTGPFLHPQHTQEQNDEIGASVSEKLEGALAEIDPEDPALPRGRSSLLQGLHARGPA